MASRPRYGPPHSATSAQAADAQQVVDLPLEGTAPSAKKALLPRKTTMSIGPDRTASVVDSRTHSVSVAFSVSTTAESLPPDDARVRRLGVSIHASSTLSRQSTPNPTTSLPADNPYSNSATLLPTGNLRVYSAERPPQETATPTNTGQGPRPQHYSRKGRPRRLQGDRTSETTPPSPSDCTSETTSGLYPINRHLGTEIPTDPRRPRCLGTTIFTEPRRWQGEPYTQEARKARFHPEVVPAKWWGNDLVEHRRPGRTRLSRWRKYARPRDVTVRIMPHL